MLDDRPSSGIAVCDVLRERIRQDRKWGEQNHKDLYWLGILTEEVGEFAQALIEGQELALVRVEAVQVAAVALAIVEAIDRGKVW